MTRRMYSGSASLVLAAGLLQGSCSLHPDPASPDAGAATAAEGWRGRGCSPVLPRGTYVLRCNGFARNGAAVLPLAVLGTVRGNAKGELVGQTRVTLGAAVFQEAIDGFARIEPDCRGAITFSVMVQNAAGWVAPAPPDDQLRLELQVLDEGDRLEGTIAAPGSAAQCELRRRHLFDGQRTSSVAWPPGG